MADEPTDCLCAEKEKENRELRRENAELKERIERALRALRNGMINHFAISALEGHK